MNPVATPVQQHPGPATPAGSGGSWWLRGCGGLVGMLLGVATGVWEVFLSPLYWGRVPIPLAPALAVVTNPALIWFTRTVTQRIGPALLPGLAWLAVMVLAADQRTEGDLLIPTTNPMGVATLLVGAMAWGIAAYRSIATSNQQR